MVTLTNTRAFAENKITGESNSDKYLSLVHLYFSLTSCLLLYCMICFPSSINSSLDHLSILNMVWF